jgi:hypothetical protein
MREICLPLTGFLPDEPADVVIVNRKKNTEQRFRLEVFDYKKHTHIPSKELHERNIQRLRKFINGYDKNWELVQILSNESRQKVFALFRYKKKQS